MAGEKTSKTAGDTVGELKELVVTYAKQETVDPLKRLGRYVGLGVGGSVALGLGVTFLLLALLRGLQQVEIFQPDGPGDLGIWTWAPYAITVVAAVVVMAIAGSRIADRSHKEHRR